MQVAEPLALYEEPANLFVAGFIGSPSMNFFSGTIRRRDGRLHFVEDGSQAAPLALPLPPELERRSASRMDRPVVLGIRPEAISNGPGASAPEAAAEVRVELAEPMGAETYLHLDTGGTTLVARVQPSGRFEAGQRIRVGFDLARAHLFDPETGVALR